MAELCFEDDRAQREFESLRREVSKAIEEEADVAAVVESHGRSFSGWDYAAYAFPRPGGSLWIVAIDGVPLYCRFLEGLAADRTGLRRLLDDLEEPEGTFRAEWLAAWGFDEAPAVADPGAEGPFAIWVQPNWYAGAGAPEPHYERDEWGEVLLFETYEEAEAYVRAYYEEPSEYEGIPACRVLAHGQAGADTLSIVKAP